MAFRIIDYKCNDCQVQFELLVDTTDDSSLPISCNKCDSENVSPVFPRPAMIEVKNSTAPGSKLIK